MQQRPAGGSAKVVRERIADGASCLIVAACCAAIAGCGRAGGQTPQVVLTSSTSASSTAHVAAMVIQPDPMDVDQTVTALEALRQAARFDEYVSATLAATTEQPANAAVRCLASEAHLAMGNNAAAAASALRSGQLAIEQHDASLAVRALRLWIVAAMRQGRPLDDANVGTLLDRIPADQPGTH